MATDTVILFNKGKRGAVDVHIPGTEREHEMLVTRKRRSDDGISDEAVKQIVKVKRPRSKSLRTGDHIILPSSVLEDPIIASQLREGVLGYRFRKAVPKKKKPTTEAAPKKKEAAPTKSEEKGEEKPEEKGEEKGKGKGAKGKAAGKSGGKE